MTVLDGLRRLMTSRAWPGAAEWLGPDRVRPTAVPAPPDVVPDATYLRLWLSEARLSHSRRWFTEWHPAVYSAVSRLDGNRVVEDVTVRHPAGIPGFEGAAGAPVSLEAPLTGLLPYGGGTVSINVGLVAVKGDSVVRTLIDVVGRLGDVAGVGGTATATSVATIVVDSLQTLVGIDGDVGALSFDTTLGVAGGGAARVLSPGYIAVLDTAPPSGLSLWVRDGRLVGWRGTGDAITVEGSYLLLRLETRSERDDWRHLDVIAGPLEDAERAFDAELRRTHFNRAIVAARTSPSLHEADRIRIAEAIRARRDTDAGLGAVATTDGDLAGVAATVTASAEEALSRSPSVAVLLTTP